MLLGKVHWRVPTADLSLLQGFDEFMNLVIDDAVEVKQITKTNSEEKRRSLGMLASFLV